MGLSGAFQRRLAVIIGASILLGFTPHEARADAAPPHAPSGSSIENGGYETNVQMVSEAVEIDIDYYTGEDVSIVEGYTVEQLIEYEEDNVFNVLANGDLSSHVEADFVMRNQGSEDEAFDVWFPIGQESGQGVVLVANFRATVNGVPAEIGQEKSDELYAWLAIWATWPAVFPAGEEVVIHVSYDTSATYSGTLCEFGYILQTGAGWYGPIGEGIVTVRLPYDVNDESVSYTFPEMESLDAGSDDFSLLVSGDEIVWRFTDYEPEHNIWLSMLAPDIWADIQAARAALAANPDSPAAKVELAHALEEALIIKYQLQYGEEFAQQALELYEEALAVEPTNIDYHVDYLGLLINILPAASMTEELLPKLEAALEIDPDDERLLRLMSIYEMILARMPGPTPTLTPTPTLWRPSPTPSQTPTFVPTDTPAPAEPPQPPSYRGIVPALILALLALVGIVARLFARKG